MTLFEVYKQALTKLENPDVDEISVRIILCEINNLKSMSDFYLRKDEEIRDLPRFQRYFGRFLKGEPVQYILRKTTFYNEEFVVDKRVLIPRQESEEVVEFAIKKTHELFGAKKLRIADVCCGSGIMGITLGKQLGYEKICFSDISKDALDVTKINCKNLNVKATYYCGDALEELIKNNEKFDLLISNPPYILENEVVDDAVLNYEPHLALFTDPNFIVYEKIIKNIREIMDKTLLVVFEIGTYSHPKLEEIIKKYCPDAEYNFLKDINGKERILYLYLK